MRLTRTATLLFAGLALPATLTAFPAMAQTTGSSMSSEHTVMVGGAVQWRDSRCHFGSTAKLTDAAGRQLEVSAMRDLRLRSTG